MTDRKIYITEYDMRRLEEYFNITPYLTGKNRQYYESLQEKLDCAEIVDPKDIPENIITMNSLIRLKDLDSGEEKTYWLVFPDKTEASQQALLSVLAPIGTALLGHKEGDIIEWNTTRGTRKYSVTEVVYQPERIGNYEL